MVCENIGVNDLGHLTFAGQDTVTLAQQYGTPAYLMDEDRIRYNCRVYMDAMKEAGYTDNDTVYVNAHGTGTPMNDVIETAAIKKALGEDNAKTAYVSSTKSMTGHMLGAAGAIEALACLFALNEGVIPPTINLNEQDENCDLNCVPNIAVEADITLALSNSLGFGGHNACLAFRKV